MSSSGPKVSIGLPVYNGERFLAEAIDSTLAQTFTDFELIISDNGSTDRTQDICSRYAAQDARVRYVRSETNRGVSWNYRRAFETARGQYFRWAPADDKFHPESLGHCVAVLDAHQEVVLCYPLAVLINEAGAVTDHHSDGLDLRSPEVARRFYDAIRRNPLVTAIYGLIRTEALRQTAIMGGFPGSDITLLAELSLYGQFLEIPRPLFYRRMHRGSSSSMTTMESVQEFYDPKKKGRLCLYLWTHLFQHASGIRRAPLTLAKKTVLFGVLLRWVIGCRDQFGRELIDAAVKLVTRRATTPIRQGEGISKQAGSRIQGKKI